MYLKKIPPEEYTIQRPRETRLGQVIRRLEIEPESPQQLIETINRYVQDSVRYALLCISEDVGPRVNLGNPGAVNGAPAFLRAFCNAQHHSRRKPSFLSKEMLDGEEFLLLGKIDLASLQKETETLEKTHPETNRRLGEILAKMSERGLPIITACAASKAIPIVIGGGDNWGYECVHALYEKEHKPVVVVNFDPHADMRDLFGLEPDAADKPPIRHSGNWMTLAFQKNLVRQYFPIGLDLNFNNEYIVDLLRKNRVPYERFTKQRIRREGITTVAQAVSHEININHAGFPIFLNFDCDSVSGIPVSAKNPDGLSMQEAYEGIEVFTSTLLQMPSMFRLAELGPDKDDPDQMLVAGRFALKLMSAFINSYS